MAVVLFGVLQREFLPPEDRGFIFGATQGPEGASLEYMNGYQKQVEVIVNRTEGIESTFSVVGSNSFQATVERAMYLGTHVRVWAHAADVPLQFTAPPGVRYEGDQVITLRLPKEQAWIVPVEDRIL